MQALYASLRVTAATMAICVAGYAGAVWAVAQAVTPQTAEGSLLYGENDDVIGSSQVAQAFTEPGYFWPRPSAVDYDGGGAGGSNWSPTSTDVADRGREIVEAYGATPDSPLPADLAAASGAGLAPHISEDGALYQVERIAETRGIDPDQVQALVAQQAFSAGAFLGPERIVNVLELNIALDAL
jgi:potassium-transporting ATPase KdpC subunit